VKTTQAIEVLQAGPFSLRDTAGILGDELLDSIIEQNALTAEQQLFLGDLIKESIEKRDRVGKFLARIAVEEEALRQEERRLAERRMSFQKIRQALTDGLKFQLENWGVLKVEGQQFTFAIKKNPPRVEITEEAAIPSEFITYSPSFDRAAIRDALQRGEDVPGARLVQDTRLEIK